MNGQGSDLDLVAIRCCGSCRFYDGERKRYKIGFCLKPTERRGGLPEATWATGICFRYSASHPPPKT